MDVKTLLDRVRIGFKSLAVADVYKEHSLSNIGKWLVDEELVDYVPQIEYLVEKNNWDLLLDAFYQTIPFGTGGRRGPVGIGPNRINIWTLQSSAQGHSQYLLKHFKDAPSRGVVIAYDVRKYTRQDEYDDNRRNPIKNLTSKTLAQKIAEVYAANGIRVFMFDDFATTPELSFMVRHLDTVSGNMISASHNPPEFNAQKVVNETGGQLIPPDDQILVSVIEKNTTKIKKITLDEAADRNLFTVVSKSDRESYIRSAKESSQNQQYRGIKIFFSPFHGTAYTSVLKVLKTLGFDITMDKISGKVDPKFSSITYHLPNPEVVTSFDALKPLADQLGVDIILVADPDGDRIGVMSKEVDTWRFFTGNEIVSLCTAYLLNERKANGRLKNSNVIIKTLVTTNFLNVLADEYNVQIIGNLLVGFKYIGNEMNKLEREGRIDDFLIGAEESHGATMGNYVRDKDAVAPAILLSELASKLHAKSKTLGSYLDDLFLKYGYFENYLTEIRLPGAEGMSKMQELMAHFRKSKLQSFGRFKVRRFVDRWDGGEFLSNSDKISRNVIIYEFENDEKTKTISVTIRPSGTEPKMKFYFEIGTKPSGDLDVDKCYAEKTRADLEKDIVKYAYGVIGIDFPDRGFLLFNQLPAALKMKYFEIEPEILKLRNIYDKEERKKQLSSVLAFLGSDPIEKIDKAFRAKFDCSVRQYLDLSNI